MALKKFQRRGSSEHQKPIGVVHSTHIIGRKRVTLPNRREKDPSLSSPFSAPSPRQRAPRAQSEGSNRLESLPRDLLVTILCKVTHEDLKQLIRVSKSVNEASSIAKVDHFAYSTPRTKPVYMKEDDLELDADLIDIREVPNAPMRRRVAKSRIDFDGIAVNLFSSFDDGWRW